MLLNSNFLWWNSWWFRSFKTWSLLLFFSLPAQISLQCTFAVSWWILRRFTDTSRILKPITCHWLERVNSIGFASTSWTGILLLIGFDSTSLTGILLLFPKCLSFPDASTLMYQTTFTYMKCVCFFAFAIYMIYII